MSQKTSKIQICFSRRASADPPTTTILCARQINAELLFAGNPRCSKIISVAPLLNWLVSNQRLSGLPGGALTSGEVRLLLGRSRKLLGKCGKLPRKLWIAPRIHCVWGKFRGSRWGTSGEVREILGSAWSFQQLWGNLTPPSETQKLCPIGGLF